MEKRTLSSPEFQFLAEESQLWEAENLITPEIRTSILARYCENFRSSENSCTQKEADHLQSLFFTALVSLGTLLLGAAVLLLVTYNWQALPPWGKFSVIGGAMAAAYLTAGGLAYFGKYVFSELAMFFGTLLYGIGIWQISQVFHVAAYEPAGLMFWALGAFLLALFMRTPLLHALAAVLLGFWCGYEFIYFPFFMNFGSIGMNTCFYALAWGVPLLAWLGWISAPWRGKSERSAECIRFLYVILFWLWLFMIYEQLEKCGMFGENQMVYYFLMLSASLLLIPQFSFPLRPSGKVMASCGAFLTGILLIPGSGRLYSHFHPVGIVSWQMMSFCLLFTASVLGYLCVRSYRLHSWKHWGNSWFFLILLIYSTIFSVSSVNSTTIIKNVLMVVFSVFMMHLGIQRNRMRTFLFGVLYFLLWMILRYADLFGNFGGMPGAALMFFICAVFLFGLSYFWFKFQKHHMLKGISDDEVQ